MQTKRKKGFTLVVLLVVIAAAQVNAVVWDVNDDLDPNYWPTEGSPVVGPWSIGWADTNSPWDVSLFSEYMGATWGNNAWVTDSDNTLFTYHPTWTCPPHGGVLEAQCMLVPSTVIRNNDPNVFSQYTVLTWTSPVTFPVVTMWGDVTCPYLTDDTTEVYIIKLEPETLDPNYFIDNPGEDPNDYYQILDTKIIDKDTPDHEILYSTETSVEVGTRILFAVHRNPQSTTAFMGLALLDVTIASDFTCQDQNDYMKADLNQDCFVNLADLALLAGDWLTCNDPQGPNCTPPFVPAVLRVDFNGYYSYNEPNNALWTYEGPGLLGNGTFWNGAEVSWETPNTILSVYHPGSDTSDDKFLLDDGVTDSGVTITLAGNEYGDRADTCPDILLADYLLGYHPDVMPPDPNIIITISGLIPGNAYRLAGYGANAFDHVGGVWSANGVGPLDLSYYAADSGILENVIADAEGKIVIEIAEDPYKNLHFTVVNGLELEGTFHAEPVRTCQSNGLYEDLDLNEDCYVNLGDYAVVAGRWLECNDPQDETCTATAP